MDAGISAVRSHFIKQMGAVSQVQCLPRIAGQIIGLLVFDGRTYSSTELASELQVSRGSISTNTRCLEHIGVIERIAIPGDRQDYYQLADDPYAPILKRTLVRVIKARQTVCKTVTALPTQGHSAVKARLNEIQRYYDSVSESLAAAIGQRQ